MGSGYWRIAATRPLAFGRDDRSGALGDGAGDRARGRAASRVARRMRADREAGAPRTPGEPCGYSPAVVQTESGRIVRSAALAVGSFLALTVAQVLYQGGDPSYRTIWAEDGRIHYQAVASHGIGALAMPYNGYLELVSRLLVLPGTWFSLTHLAVYLSVAGAATGALVALAVYRLSAGLIDSTVLRVALALAVALHPVLLQENLANITNIIWVLAFAVFFALLHRPENKGDVALGAAVAFLGMASTILGLVFLPIAAYVAWTRRDGATRVVLGAYGLGVVLQLVAYVTESTHGINTPGQGQLLNLYIARVLGITAVGDPGIAHLWNDGGKTLVYPFAFVVVATIAVLIACNRGWTLGLGLVAVGYSIALFFGDLLVRGDAGLPLGSTWNDNAARYNVLSVLFLLAAIAIMIPHARVGALPRTVMSWALLAQIVVVVVLGFHGENGRSKGPEWYPALVAQAKDCQTSPVRLRFVETTPGIPWGIFFTCNQLQGIGT